MTKELTCDVLVVGAGVSGLAAAISAAQGGCRTIVLEQTSSIGGTVTAGMHRYLCGLYGDTPSSGTLNSGLARSLCISLIKRSTANKPVRLGKVWVFTFRRDELKKWLQAAVKKNKKNLEIIFNCRACAVTREKGLIRAVHARGKQVSCIIYPKVVIDASGDGSMITLSKAKSHASSYARRQLAGFTFRLQGVHDPAGMLPIKVPYYLKFAVFTPLEKQGEGLIQLNIPPGPETSGLKKQAQAALRHLRKFLPELKNAAIVEYAPFLLEREGARLAGRYTLTVQDVLGAKKFKDGVVRNSWPIEFWDQKKGRQLRYLKAGTFYEIPRRALQSKNIKNLLAAGRCISVTREALGSTRVAGTCIAVGEQAGVLAAQLCIDSAASV